MEPARHFSPAPPITAPVGKGADLGHGHLKHGLRCKIKLILFPLYQSTPTQENSPYIYLYSQNQRGGTNNINKKCAEKLSPFCVQGKILEPTTGNN